MYKLITVKDHLKNLILSGRGTPRSSLMDTIASFKVILLITLFGKYFVN